MKTGYLAPEGLEEVLKSELQEKLVGQWGRLFLIEGPPIEAYWFQNIWYDVQELSFQSISEGAQKLKSLNKLWAHYPTQFFRRAELISKQLPFFSPKPLSFPSPLPKAPLGNWTLIDPNTILASSRTSSPFALGEVHFIESKIPPSRAYLKLWEILTLLQIQPKAREKCLEIGAAPGSWTWVLQQLGAEVIAVDRAPLDPCISRSPQVISLKKDAFTLGPQDFPEVQWLFSDVICYPSKLFDWLQPWIASNVNLICTLKFQGEIEKSVIQDFARVPGSILLHLFHNKHELTWARIF